MKYVKRNVRSILKDNKMLFTGTCKILEKM